MPQGSRPEDRAAGKSRAAPPSGESEPPTGRLAAVLGLRYPIVQGPFGGGLSSVALVSAVSEGGGLGSYAAHHLHPHEITALVAELRASTGRAFSVNLWVPQDGEEEARRELTGPELAGYLAPLRPWYRAVGLDADRDAPGLEAVRSEGPAFEEQAQALLAAQPPSISFVMGVPPAWIVTEARRRGIVLLGTATTVDEAVALEAAGMDAIVASGSDAGGHRGTFLGPLRESLIGTFSLIPQVADAVSVPVIAAGGITDARGVAAALLLGADAVQIGTGFLATEESAASSFHKRELLASPPRPTVLTRLFSGRRARGIANQYVQEMAQWEEAVAPYPVHNALMAPVRRAAAQQGLAEHFNLWAGQATALATGGSAQDYLNRLVSQTEKLLGRAL